MYGNYIFDLYGTLVDNRTNENKTSLWKHMAFYMTLQGAPYSAAELRKRYFALVDAQRLDRYERRRADIPDLTPDEIEVDLSAVFSQLYVEKGVNPSSCQITDCALMFRTVSTDYYRLYEGAKELLTELHRQGRGVFLLSNAQRIFTEPELRSSGLYDLFDDVLISSDIGFMKPSPQFYDALLQKHHLDPKACVMIGNDWQADAWGAYNNGLACMYIHTAQSPEPAGELPPGCVRLEKIADVIR